jgi:hypothetical protein
MNRKICSIFLAALVCLAFGLLTSCSSSSSTPPPPTIAITATSADATQSTTVGTAFANPLGVNVTSNGSADSGVTVTYAATASSGGATCTLSATTATTDANGNVTSVTCTANGTAGSYTVTATVTGATTPATFTLTNVPPSVFVFYVNGLEAINSGPNYYAIAGAISFDVNGNILGGVQDYNDGYGITSPSGGDTIAPTSGTTGSMMTVNQDTGTAILTLVTNNTYVGVAGTETFALQFMSQSHALITQFDGSATSSGSMDFQTAQSSGGNFAFTLSGTDYNYNTVAYGGVFSDNGTISGTADANDAGTPYLASPGNMTGPDNGTAGAYGRGTATVTITNSLGTTTLSLVYYVVGPEAIRIIDMDAGGVGGAGTYNGSAAVGSAYGQGSTPNFDSTALGAADVFGILSNPWGSSYAAAGNIAPVGAVAGTAGAAFTGEGDIDEEGTLIVAPSAPSTPNVTANYTIGTNGYGNINGISGLGDENYLGLYMTDPRLNLLDPNNTSGGGGGLILDLTGGGLSGTGVVVPQATTLAATDLNNSYGFGAQSYYAFDAPSGELDYVGQGTFASLALTGTGDISDLYGVLNDGTPGEYTAIPFAGTAAAPDTAGRYTYPSATPLTFGPVVTGGNTFTATTVMYEASGSLVFWIDEDAGDLWLGTFQAQSASSLKAMHVKHGAVPKAQLNRKR